MAASAARPCRNGAAVGGCRGRRQQDQGVADPARRPCTTARRLVRIRLSQWTAGLSVAAERTEASSSAPRRLVEDGAGRLASRDRRSPRQRPTRRGDRPASRARSDRPAALVRARRDDQTPRRAHAASASVGAASTSTSSASSTVRSPVRRSNSWPIRPTAPTGPAATGRWRPDQAAHRLDRRCDPRIANSSNRWCTVASSAAAPNSSHGATPRKATESTRTGDGSGGRSGQQRRSPDALRPRTTASTCDGGDVGERRSECGQLRVPAVAPVGQCHRVPFRVPDSAAPVGASRRTTWSADRVAFVSGE